jgi:DNA replication protein DnaC
MTPLDAWRDNFLRTGRIDTAHADGFVGKSAMEETQARIPARYADALVTESDVCSWMYSVADQAVADRRAAVNITTGPSLLLLGKTGTGKTWQAYGAIRCFAACEIHTRWQFITAADLYALLRPRAGVDPETEFRRVADAGLLVVDDIGAAKASEWVEEVNYRLINHRYERMRPTLLTSNVLPGDLAKVLGDRVASRLTEMSARATLKGADRRYAA